MKRKGVARFALGSQSFLDFIEDAELTDLGFTRSQFTWCNNHWGKARVWKCLDRILVNQQCLSLEVNTEHEEKVLALEYSLEEGSYEEGQLQLAQAQGELKESLLREVAYWRQKACLRWLQEGDANSKFFHAQVKQRRARTFIHRMKDGNEVWTEEAGRIQDMATAFFEDMLSQPGQVQVDPSLLSVIPSIVSEQDNLAFQRFPMEEEIKTVIFQMDGDSSSGPDGFKGSGAALGAYIYGLVLVPKIPGALSFSDFRPISLCNFVNKIISKLSARRLESVLPKIISPQQSGFAKGRQISDNILLALEMCSTLGKKEVMWIFSVFSGFTSRDPLSPALFIITAEVLSRRLNDLSGDSRFVPFFVTRDSLALTHLVYADDIIIFCNGGKRSLGCHAGVRGLPGDIRAAGERGEELFLDCFLSWSVVINEYSALLIKHVLSSMPIHIVAVLEPPRGVVSDLEQLFARFFWEESEFGAKRHWVKWEKLCFLVEKGGVNFRSLQAIVEAFSCKLWWMFRRGQSLWAQFIRARYFGSLHPNQGPISAQLSASCKRIIRVRSTMEHWLKWDLSRGEVAFWWITGVGWALWHGGIQSWRQM
nr:uncharacterized protein LOC113739011 [Coffea arabica]